MKTKEAFETLAKAFGLRVNCEPPKGNGDMDELLEKAKALQANGKLTSKQFETLQGLDPDQRRMVRALMDAMEGMPEEDPEGMEDDMEEEDMPAMAANQGKGGKGSPPPKQHAQAEQPDIDELVANKVAEHLRRVDVTTKLLANAQCPFTEDELKTMAVDHLEKFEKTIRPADYSGQGGMATNGGVTEDVQPLILHRGLMAKPASKQEH